MYNNKLIVALKSQGKVLREFRDTVYLPFNSEYSILVKNLNVVRVRVNITVDGQPVVEELVINPLQDVEIERFVKDKNFSVGNRLKFIKRTVGIEQNRGVNLDDGFIRVEFQYEKIPTASYFFSWNREWEIYQRGKEDGKREAQRQFYYSPWMPIVITKTTSTTSSISTASFNSENVSSPVVHSLSQNVDINKNHTGITVPGSISYQQFQSVESFPLEQEKHVIVLKMLGETKQGKVVKDPITVKTKQKCVTCGRVNKVTSKFCSECGTGLEIV